MFSKVNYCIPKKICGNLNFVPKLPETTVKPDALSKNYPHEKIVYPSSANEPSFYNMCSPFAISNPRRQSKKQTL